MDLRDDLLLLFKNEDVKLFQWTVNSLVIYTFLINALKEKLRLMKKDALSKGKKVSELVFCEEKGNVLEQNKIRGIWKRTLKTAGLRYLPFHSLRHSFASLLLSQGESVMYVKEQLGHHSISMTVDIYGHRIQGSNREAVDKLDDETTHTPYAPNKKESHLTY